MQSILTQYGSRFSEEQKTDLRRLCHLAQPPLDRLRAYSVENGVNPALYLKPLVEREKNPLAKTVPPFFNVTLAEVSETVDPLTSTRASRRPSSWRQAAFGARLLMVTTP